MFFLFQATISSMALITEEIDLEREYSPSMWSKRFSTPQEVIQHHVNFVTAGSSVFLYKVRTQRKESDFAVLLALESVVVLIIYETVKIMHYIMNIYGLLSPT